MEFLLGVVSSLLIEIFKWLGKRWGKPVTKRAIYLALFALSLGWTIFIHSGVINQEALRLFVSMLFYTVGIYEILIKQMKTALK
ncbi:MAG: hypothetical protein HYV42_05540 [Candidatus Magasanikbacteria bacterium]|nr:hypothetical protein [Candidatus Magasanikbacteria bacterium]